MVSMSFTSIYHLQRKFFESKIRVNGQDVTATVSNGYLDIPVSEEIGKIKLMLMTEN